MHSDKTLIYVGLGALAIGVVFGICMAKSEGAAPAPQAALLDRAVLKFATGAGYGFGQGLASASAHALFHA